MNLLEITNTEEGKYLIGRLGQKPEFPIIYVGKNCFIENTGERVGNRPLLRATFFSKNPIERLFQPIIEKINIAKTYDHKMFREIQENPRGAFLHFSGLEEKNYKYPQILLAISTFNPDANPESTSVDGAIARVGGINESFATIRAGVGTASEDAQASTDTVHLDATTTTNQYGYMSRGIYLFDTSSLNNEAIISSAVFSLYITAKSSGLGGSVRLVNSNPASNTAVANADYQGEVNNNTLQSDDALTYAGFSLNAYNDWTLNSTGRGNISLTGITKFGLKSSFDQSNTAPTWVSAAASTITVNQADNASNDPKLVVTYAPPHIGSMLQMIK